MSGPEHYREAERIRRAAVSNSHANEEGFTGWSRADLAALAQVHATLALTAIQAERWIDGDAHPDWPSVIA